jgi:DNA-directed RNA polymerase subunit RPC12/RpoP
MSDLIDRIFRALPESEWAGGPAFTFTVRPGVEPMEPSHERSPVRRPPVVLTCADCGTPIGPQAARCRSCARRHLLRERMRAALEEARHAAAEGM